MLSIPLMNRITQASLGWPFNKIAPPLQSIQRADPDKQTVIKRARRSSLSIWASVASNSIYKASYSMFAVLAVIARNMKNQSREARIRLIAHWQFVSSLVSEICKPMETNFSMATDRIHEIWQRMACLLSWTVCICFISSSFTAERRFTTPQTATETPDRDASSSIRSTSGNPYATKNLEISALARRQYLQADLAGPS